MGILSYFRENLGVPSDYKSESVSVTLPTRSVEEIRSDLMAGSAIANPIQISAVYACAKVIAEDLAGAPVILQRRNAAGGYEAATDHPLYDLLARAPNDYMTAFEFREWLGYQLALTGNAYSFIQRDVRGQPIAIIPLPSGAVTVTQGARLGEIVYRLNVSGTPTYEKSNIWHHKTAAISQSYTADDPRTIAARAIGLASNLELFGSKLFEQGARPSGFLSTDAVLNAEQFSQIKAAWDAQQAGVENAHKTAFLTGGLKWQQAQTNPNDAQFIESRRFQIEEICRIMRVDPLMIQQATNSASYSSIEQRFLAHLTNTMQPWFSRFEQSAECSLLTVDEQQAGYRIHIDTSSLARGSALDLVNATAIAVQNGFISRNEAREKLGYDHVSDPDADKLTPSANLYGQPNKPTE